MKKFFSLVLVFVMVLSLTTVAWGATTVTTKQELKAALAAGGEVVLGADILVDDHDPQVPHGVKAVLNLNGHKISFTNGWRLIVAGTLTVKDTSADGDGTITANAGPTIQLGFTTDGKQPGATLNLLSGSIVNTNPAKFAISGAGTAGTNSNQNTTVNISGGKVTAVGVAIYHPQAGTLSISDGEITGDSAIGMKSGTLNITGGTLRATGTYASAPATNSNGINTDGSVICIDSNSSYAGNMVVNISNATLTSTYGHIIREIGDGVTNDITSISVTSGTFTAAADKEAINLQNTTPSANASISGGTFNTDVSDYLADGLELVSDGAGGLVAIAKTSGSTTANTIKKDGYSLVSMDNTVSQAIAADFTKTVISPKVVTEGTKTTTTYYADRYVIDGTVCWACDSTIADAKLVKDGVVVAFLTADTGVGAGTSLVATSYVEAKAAADRVCGDYNVNTYVVGGKNYAVGTAQYAVYNGKFVGIAAAASTDKVNHTFTTKLTYNAKGEVVAVKCDTCKKDFTVVKSNKVPVTYAGEVKALTVDGTAYAILLGSSASSTAVTSPKTFDAGIALYAGMALMSVAGSAVVIGKKKEF